MSKNSHIDFETRKSVHINLTRETHAALRSYLFKEHLSMQEVFEELARQIVEEQPYMLDTLSNISLAKRQRATRKMSSTDAESIFKVIEESNPLGANEEDA